MSVLKWIGYILVSITVLSVVLSSGLILAAITAVIGVILAVVAVIAFVTLLVKEVFEG